ncbi:MAG TPA: HEAT repeat domain-containing protein [Planctomycetota bacterium]
MNPLMLSLLLASQAQPREEWFRGLHLGPVVAEADLILVARVTDLSEAKIVQGGKGEFTLQQFVFLPVRMLKGVFARESLSLTSGDLGLYNVEPGRIERGQLRLLALGRRGPGYHGVSGGGTAERALPLLEGENDPLLSAVQVLIAAGQEHDLRKRLDRIVEALPAAKGPGAVALLTPIRNLGLLAAQAPGTHDRLLPFLADPSPAVREAAAWALLALLEEDYLVQPPLRKDCARALAGAIEKAGAGVAGRVALWKALAAAEDAALEDPRVREWLKADRVLETWTEKAAHLEACGSLKTPEQRRGATSFLSSLALDATPVVEAAAERLLARLGEADAAAVLTARFKAKLAAGMGGEAELARLGELPAEAAIPALLGIGGGDLNATERLALVNACERLRDARLVPLLAGLLSPREPEVRRGAIEALRKIDTADAARAARPRLREEMDLSRKLRMAALLGRHGLREGYPYALEHMSEPGLLEEAIDALEAIREPGTVERLREILRTSNDVQWNTAAIRALGRLGDRESAPRLLEIAQDLRHALAAPALIALGDLGEEKAIPKVREALSSRGDHLIEAGARASGKFLAKADDLRLRLAELLADADGSERARSAALEALAARKDAGLDAALAAAARDAGLEGSELLLRVHALLRERKVKLP